jgi:hypothetical protein
MFPDSIILLQYAYSTKVHQPNFIEGAADKHVTNERAAELNVI